MPNSQHSSLLELAEKFSDLSSRVTGVFCHPVHSDCSVRRLRCLSRIILLLDLLEPFHRLAQGWLPLRSRNSRIAISLRDALLKSGFCDGRRSVHVNVNKQPEHDNHGGHYQTKIILEEISRRFAN